MAEKQNMKHPEPGFDYAIAPQLNAFPGNAEDCFDMVNQYGTYEIQRTADTGNFFPAIAQGLPKDADFQIWAKNMPDVEAE